MNIAVVGGGVRCRKLIELIDAHTFYEISPKVVAVADIRSDASGFIKAKEKGLHVTDDYNEFFDRDDLDLIMELTGDMDIFYDIMAKKKPTVRIIGHVAAVFFWEIARVLSIQKETDQKLKETTAEYDVIINEFIHENIIVIGPDYRILDVNEALLNDLGVKREEAIGKCCYDITASRDTPCTGKEIPCPLDESLRTQKPSQATHVRYDSENNARHYVISCYPFFENDTLVRAMTISREITKEINMQKAMMQQEKLASIGRLSAGVSHEINNPLTTILTSSMLIQEDIDPDDPMYRELETISQETLRCRKIVTGLLDFARQTRPAKKLNDANEIVSHSFVLTRKQAAFQDVLVELNLSENMPKTYMDKDQIEQSMINLTLNAIEATKPGGNITLSTLYDAETDTINISVKDTGVGIQPEHLDKIFDPFFTTTDGGTGLGLAVTHGIIEQHGGAIKVRSTPGRGTCFTIQLPLDRGRQNVE